MLNKKIHHPSSGHPVSLNTNRMKKMTNTAVFISGGGTNLQSIIDFREKEPVHYDIKLVLSNVPDVYGLQRAEKAGIPVVVIDHKTFESREQFEKSVHDVLLEHQIELIALAGFMRLLTPWFVQRWAGRLLNIHPSLLPAFPGLHTHQKALAYGVKFAGCSVFFVDEGVDSGRIIDQAVVPVLLDDTEDTLAARILIEEHNIFPNAINQVAKGAVSLK